MTDVEKQAFLETKRIESEAKRELHDKVIDKLIN